MIIYGRNAVHEALRGRRKVIRIWVTKAAAQLDWLKSVQVKLLNGSELEGLCKSPDHQGICAEVGEYPYVDTAQLLREPDGLIVALDQITDPHNFGAICRTAECVGATGVVIGRHRSAEVTPAVCKASAGAVEHLRIAKAVNLSDFLKQAKETGYWSYGASADAKARFDAPDYRGGVVLVMGSEGKGLRPRVAAECDQLISLPLLGKIDSLNVSAASAALLYGILLQRLDQTSA